MDSFSPPIIPVEPAGNSLLRCSTRTSGAPDAVAAVLPMGKPGLGADAGDIMVWAPVLERRLCLGAFGNYARASRVKSAAGRWIQRVWNRAGNRLQAAVPAAVHSIRELRAGIAGEICSRPVDSARLESSRESPASGGAGCRP